MRAFGRVVLAAAALLVLASAQKGKNGNDERPYEFGFTIPGEQHRQESKDTNGIIMGEFGFITADGIYHVTVFATDKDGNYKIISQKNIRVGPSPWGKKVDTPAPTTTTTPSPPPPPPPSSEFSLNGKPGCSGCVIPTPPPPGSPPRPPLAGSSLGTKYPLPQSVGKYPASPVGQSQPNGIANRFPSAPFAAGRPNGNPSGIYPDRPAPFPGARPPQQRPSGVATPQQPPGGVPATYPQRPSGFPASQQQPGGVPATYPQRPSGFPASQQPPGGALTPQRRPDGALPDGVTFDDIMGLLYKFNYTAGFHGHHETGFRNGDKEGEFYTNFRDGLARKVTYVADKDGFRPKVTIVKVSDIDTPKAETEKEFGLKGYEFKWFNRRR